MKVPVLPPLEPKEPAHSAPTQTQGILRHYNPDGQCYADWKLSKARNKKGYCIKTKTAKHPKYCQKTFLDFITIGKGEGGGLRRSCKGAIGLKGTPFNLPVVYMSPILMIMMSLMGTTLINHPDTLHVEDHDEHHDHDDRHHAASCQPL